MSRGQYAGGRAPQSSWQHKEWCYPHAGHRNVNNGSLANVVTASSLLFMRLKPASARNMYSVKMTCFEVFRTTVVRYWTVVLWTTEQHGMCTHCTLNCVHGCILTCTYSWYTVDLWFDLSCMQRVLYRPASWAHLDAGVSMEVKLKVEIVSNDALLDFSVWLCCSFNSIEANMHFTALNCKCTLKNMHSIETSMHMFHILSVQQEYWDEFYSTIM